MINKKVIYVLAFIFVSISAIVLLVIAERVSYHTAVELSFYSQEYNNTFRHVYKNKEIEASIVYKLLESKLKLSEIELDLDAKDDRDVLLLRSILLYKARGLYEELREKYGIRHIHLITKDNISFLRLHSPDNYGDDLGDFREIIKYVNEHKEYADGVEVGRHNTGLRFVFPIFNIKNVYLGCLDISFSPEAFMREIIESYNVLCNMHIKKEIIERHALPEYLKANFMQSMFDDYMIDKKALQLINNLNEGNLKKVMSDNSNIKEQLYENFKSDEIRSMYNRRTQKVITTIPIHDYTGKNKIGVFTIMGSTSHIGSNTGHFVIVYIVWELLVMIALYAYYVQYKKNKVIAMQQEELLISKKVAEKANEAKSLFLANMSHEIRTPINAITGLTKIAMGTELDEEQRDYLYKVYQSSNLLLGIINDILDFSKIEAGKMDISKHNFKFEDVLSTVDNQISYRLCESEVTLEYVTDSRIPEYLYGDSLRIIQILNNFCSNAVKFTSEGKIIVTSELVSEDGDDLRLRFSVADTGIGMTEDQLQRIFHDFTQADSSITKKYGGTGLGLTISKSLAEMMNGRVWVESEHKKGSCFYLEIPLETGEMEEEKTADQQARFISEIRDKKILIVEDNKFNRLLVETLFSKVGLVYSSAFDGAMALKMLSEETFDLVLMDIQMPVMDGYEATRIIRKSHGLSELPVIALSANVSMEEKERAAEAGMDDYITKPINFNELFSIMHKHIRK